MDPGIEKWNRQADNARDLLFFSLMSQCRTHHRKKHPGKSVYDCTRERLPVNVRVHENDSAMEKAFLRGKKIQAGQLERKKVGRQATRQKMYDVVEAYTIIGPVYQALKWGMTKKDAYEYAKLTLEIDYLKYGGTKPLTESGIRAVFEQYEKQWGKRKS